MAKYAPDAFYDAALNTVRSATTQITICSSQPTTFAEATTTFMLGRSSDPSSTPNAAISTSDFGALAPDSSGRKLDVNARAGIHISTAGSAQHVALVSGAALLYVTTCTAQTVSIGNKVNMPTWKINIQGPT